MPELPEVQTVVNDLNRKVKGRRITGVWFDWPKLIKDPYDQYGGVKRRKIAHKHVAVFGKLLKGERIISVRRRGKSILVYLTGDKLLLIHQKMTGHMLVGKWQIVNGNKIKPLGTGPITTDPYNQYIHLIIYLDNGKMLALSDLRKFAKAILGTTAEIENLPELANLGPDALDPKLDLKKFAEILTGERRKIKQALMDPYVIAGIGNIYSDDILWTAKIHPFRMTNKLTAGELKNLWLAMRSVLKKAVRLRGTSTSDFRDTAGLEGGYTDYRLVYQREGQPCVRCKTKIKRVKLGGRSAHFCPRCQTL